MDIISKHSQYSWHIPQKCMYGTKLSYPINIYQQYHTTRCCNNIVLCWHSHTIQRRVWDGKVSLATCNPRSLQWRHNGHDSVSNHQPHHCLRNRLFRRRSKKTSKLRVTGLCEGNSPATGEFPAQRAGNAEMFPFDDVIRLRGNNYNIGALCVGNGMPIGINVKYRWST